MGWNEYTGSGNGNAHSGGNKAYTNNKSSSSSSSNNIIINNKGYSTPLRQPQHVTPSWSPPAPSLPRPLPPFSARPLSPLLSLLPLVSVLSVLGEVCEVWCGAGGRVQGRTVGAAPHHAPQLAPLPQPPLLPVLSPLSPSSARPLLRVCVVCLAGVRFGGLSGEVTPELASGARSPYALSAMTAPTPR
eukprot:1859731-Rhodomonas_salina.1